jgi:hypothetical protein
MLILTESYRQKIKSIFVHRSRYDSHPNRFWNNFLIWTVLLTAVSTSRETPRFHAPRIRFSTVQWRLQNAGRHTSRPCRGPILTNVHRRRRFTWSHVHDNCKLSPENQIDFCSPFTIRFSPQPILKQLSDLDCFQIRTLPSAWLKWKRDL